MKCQNPQCLKETTNPKFCSKSCACKYNNVKFPKRKTNKKCITCGSIVKSWRHSRCALHHDEYIKNKFENKTIGEYRNSLSVKGKHPSWLHAHIRYHAGVKFKHLKLQPCAICGYKKHVELAHIRPIHSFPNDTLLSEVNHPTNIIQLCPNCHWEFDNKLIYLK